MTPRQRKAMYAEASRRRHRSVQLHQGMTQLGLYGGAALGAGAGLGLATLGARHGLRDPRAREFRDPRVRPGQKQIGMGQIIDMEAGKSGVFRVRRVGLGERATKLYQKVPKIPMSAYQYENLAARGIGALAVGGMVGGAYVGYQAGRKMLRKRQRVRRAELRTKRG